MIPKPTTPIRVGILKIVVIRSPSSLNLGPLRLSPTLKAVPLNQIATLVAMYIKTVRTYKDQHAKLNVVRGITATVRRYQWPVFS